MYFYGNLSTPLINECKDLGMHPEAIEKYAKYYMNKQRTAKNGGRSKTGYRDSDKTKVYRSEWAFQSKVNIRQFDNLTEAEKRFNQIKKSKLWGDIGKSCYLVDNRRMGRATAGRAHIGGKIELGKTGMDEYTLIHEMAHQTRNSMHHGVQFRIHLLKLVSRFMGREAASILKAEFKERKLKLSMPKPRSPASWFKSYQHMEKVRNGNNNER
jgi:hypothetical protein